jgi:hypothetical protein
MQLTPTLTDILQAAVLAPSADNRHRLRFEPTTDGVLVWSEPGRLAGLTGYKRTLDLVSLGTVIENIVLRAGAHRLATSIELFNTADQIAANIKFQSTANEADPLHAAIPIRHTNRCFFNGPPEDPAILQSIGDAARQIPGCSLDWLDSPEQRSKVLRLIRLAEGERFRNRILHTELFETIRFELGWHQTCEEALPPGALGIEAPLRPFFRLIRHWPVMRILNYVGAYKQLGWRAGDLPCRFAPHLGVICAPSLIDRDQINAGRAFQRAWLSIAQHGLALQPMPASVLYAQEMAVNQGIPGELQRYLHHEWEELQPGKIPLMVFRMGRTKKAPGLVSGRHPLEYYLKPRQ